MQSFDPITSYQFQKSILKSSQIFQRSKSASTSKRNSINTQKFDTFIPFVHERDSMGRLLSKKLHDVDLHFKQSLKSSPENRNKVKANKQFSKTAKYPWFGTLQLTNKTNYNPQKTFNINFFKQQSHQFKLTDLQKKKQRKRFKLSVQIQEAPKKAEKQKPRVSTQLIVYEQPDTCLRRVKSSILNRKKKTTNQQAQIIQIQQKPKVSFRNQFPFVEDQMKKIQKKVRLLPSPKQKKTNKKNDDQYNPLRQSLNGKFKGKIKQDPQLQRFKEMQSLSVKIFSNFEQGHQKFIKTMKNAMKDGLRIKRQLQID